MHRKGEEMRSDLFIEQSLYDTSSPDACGDDLLVPFLFSLLSLIVSIFLTHFFVGLNVICLIICHCLMHVAHTPPQ